MKLNQDTTIIGSKIVLVPYRKDHVLKYHGWMKSEELQKLTASEPLTLEEEYKMQQSWAVDEDKCTFIILDAERYTEAQNEIESMVGDVNLFFTDIDDKHSAEVEIMIAEASCRGRGFGKDALTAMFLYGVKHLGVKKYTAKIGYSNITSQNMFKKIGFKEVSRSDHFEEVSFELPVTEHFMTWLSEHSQHITISSNTS